MKLATPQPLSDFIQVGARFLRSVNLEKDYAGGQRNGDYIVTPNARQVLNRVAEGLRNQSPYRAWTITGPYGVGKSAFAVYLTRLLCPNGDSTAAAREQLEEMDSALAQRLLGVQALEKSRKGFFPILITARRAPTSLCFLQGISTAISNVRERQFQSSATNLGHLLRQAQRETFVDSSSVMGALAEVNSSAINAGYSGVLVLIDELGKLFEFAARSPHKADVFLLQQLAEQASRSANAPFLLIGLLHQSFQDYGQHLDVVSRKEWAKIQGRYEDIAFLEPADQVIRMIASAIRWKNKTPEESVRKKISAISHHAADCGIIPTGMRRDDFEAAAVAAYPLHPSTLVALPFLFKRFAQNERSLFSYLSSLEPLGFQSFLQSHEFNRENPSFVRLENLFDYFTQNFGTGLFRQPHARRWMEAADVLDRKDNLQPQHISLVKSIGLLNALGEFSPLSAREPVIHYALNDSLASATAVATGLEFLKDQSVLTYRKFNDTYRIWEGSDVDLDERIAEGERKTREALGLSNTLARYLQARPLVARRHSFETGALRFFSVTYVDDVEELQRQAKLKSASDGQVVVCLSASVAQVQQFRNLVETLQPGIGHLLIAIPQDIGEIRAAASELAALRWVWDNTPDLRDDRAARRELALRIADAEQLLKANVHRLLDPRDDPSGSKCLWYYHGTEQPMGSPVEVSQLLSYVCDKLFSDAPHIRNELIVRRSLSSQSAAARRNLVEAMLTRASLPALGIEGYPPERSMYESVLRATGLHTKVDSERWQISAPSKQHPTNLWPAWQRLSDLVFKLQPEPQPLDKIFRALAAAPCGVMDGLHPVLLCAFMSVHADEVTLYREGTFLPAPGMADFELLMRRPELFAIAGSRVKGARAEVVNRLAKGLGTKPATVTVVRELFKMVRSLPEFAWRTNRLPETTRKMRVAFDSAKSPERFLFVELPQSLERPVFSDDQSDPRQIEGFFNCLNQNIQAMNQVTPKVIETARDQLLQACGFAPGSENWQQLRETALRLEPRVTHTALLGFLRRLTQSQNDYIGIASVLALVANCPPASWTDFDVDRFPESAKGTGARFVETREALEDSDTTTIFKQLSPQQRKQAARLQHDIRQLPGVQASKNDPLVIRAALLALAEDLHKSTPKT
jgi:hypothetical protein